MNHDRTSGKVVLENKLKEKRGALRAPLSRPVLYSSYFGFLGMCLNRPTN